MSGTEKSKRLNPRGTYCIARGTPIETPKGPKPVEEIRSGDQVWGYDEARGEPVVAKVTAASASSASETIKIGTLRVTADHLVFANGQWKRAGELNAADRLLTKDLKQHSVDLIEVVPGTVDVYDLTIDGPHNVFAGGVLVHNRRR